MEDGVGVEWWHPRVELIQNAAQSPQIGGVVVRLLLYDLRRHVQRRSLDGSQDQGGDAHRSGKPVARFLSK